MAALGAGIGVTWIAFWIYWLAAASTAKRTVKRNPYHVAVRLAILAIVIALRVAFRHTVLVHAVVLEVIGTILFVAGLAIAIWARRHLGANWGMPMTEKQGAELVTTGPYRLVRNPIYSGIMLALLGTAIALDLYLLIAVVLLGAYFVYSAKVEEGIMLRLFPDTYPRYRARTKIMIPYLL